MDGNKKTVLIDELVAEQKIVYNQGLMKTVYKFENNKAVNCISTTEFYDKTFVQIAYEANQVTPEMTKNIKFNGTILEYEWSDDFFQQKGKGESKEVIARFLKNMGWKIKK